MMLLTLLFMLYGLNSVSGRGSREYTPQYMKVLADPIICETREELTFGIKILCGPTLKKKYNKNKVKTFPTLDDLRKVFEETECPQTMAETLGTFMNKKEVKGEIGMDHTLWELIELVTDKWLRDNYNKKEIYKLFDELPAIFKEKNEKKIIDFMQRRLPNDQNVPRLMRQILDQINKDTIRRQKYSKKTKIVKKQQQLTTEEMEEILWKTVAKMPALPLPKPVNVAQEADKLNLIAFEIPSKNYDFQSVEWTPDEIEKEENKEQEKQMKFKNKLIRYWKTLHDKKDEEWFKLIRRCMMGYDASPTQIGKVGKEWFVKWGADKAEQLALLSYTNEDNLQSIFSQTFRKSQYDKKQQQKWIFWNVLLNDAFAKWTKYCEDHLDDTECNTVNTYTGYRGNLCMDYLDLLDKEYVEYKGILSTSTDITVSKTFATKGSTFGMLIHWEAYNKGPYKPIPAYKFSDYGSEWERIYYDAKLRVLQIELFPSSTIIKRKRGGAWLYRRWCVDPYEKKKNKKTCGNLDKRRYGIGACEVLSKHEYIVPEYNGDNIIKYQVYELILVAAFIIIVFISCFIMGGCFGFVVATFITK